MSEWTQNDQHNAYRQGWGIFDVNTPDCAWAIQRLDDPGAVFDPEGGGWLSPDHWEGPGDLSPLFDSDEAALAYVRLRADQGDELAQRALKAVA